MIKGITTAGVGQVSKMTRMEVIANNLANMSTTGFKRDSVFLQLVKNADAGRAHGGDGAPLARAERVTDFSEGPLNPTNNSLDVSFQGKGFFVIETPDGQRFTRNGNFRLTTEGTLVTAQGYSVMGTGGRIQIPDPETLSNGKLVITESGEVLVNNKPAGRLRVVDFENTSGLKKERNSLFSAPATLQPTEVSEKNVRVMQGYLEGSNVEGLEEMIAMIELSRSFESNQKVIQAQDSSIEKAIEVGRI